MATTDPSSIQCVVNGAGKLPPQLTAESICKAIDAAVAQLPGSTGVTVGHLSVTVTVVSNSKLVARITLAGASLPEQRVASSDGPLNANAIAMLSRAIAGEIVTYGQDRGV
jgi:hypothetical protein